MLKLFPGKGAPPPPLPGDPPAAPAPAPVAIELRGNSHPAFIRSASDERILGVSDECNANELGDTSESKFEPGDMIGCLRKFGPGATVERTIIGQGAPPPPPPPGDPLMIEDMPGGAVKSKFEPDVTVEPKVGVIPGAATQGNSHPADRLSDTAKRKIGPAPGVVGLGGDGSGPADERTIAEVVSATAYLCAARHRQM